MPRKFAILRDSNGDQVAIRADLVTSISIGYEDDSEKRTGFIEVYLGESESDGYWTLIGDFAEIVAEIENCLSERESWQD